MRRESQTSTASSSSFSTNRNSISEEEDDSRRPTFNEDSDDESETGSPPPTPGSSLGNGVQSDSRDPFHSHKRSFSTASSSSNDDFMMPGSMMMTEPPPKQARIDEPASYSNVAHKMMAKMGHKAGTGLGKAGQGIVEPVKMSTQRGRRGLGLVIQGLEDDSTTDWDPDQEVVEIEEKVDWLPTCSLPVPSIEEMRSWMVTGDRKENIEDETRFVDPEVLNGILRCKSVFDRLDSEEMRKARTRSNPYETIRGAVFQNRAAMKMANMDAVFGFIFTEPSKKSLLGYNHIFSISLEKKYILILFRMIFTIIVKLAWV